MEEQKTINLIEFLTEILNKSDIIKKKDKYVINYNSLYQKYKFSYLLEYCEENKYKKNLITCEKLLYFLDVYIHQSDTIGANKKTNTVGKVSMIFDLVFALYKTKYITEDYIVEDHYNYNVIYNYTWFESFNTIAPFNRLAFRISHLIKQNIKKYYSDYLDVEFELNLNDGTGKKYDIIIKNKENKELMIIEIQEDSSNHNNSVNDKYKEFIINSKGLRMIYFDEKMMVEGKYDYECEFFADLLHTCNKILISTSKDYRNKNVLLEVGIIGEKKIVTYQKRLTMLDKNTNEFKIIETEIKKWKKLIKDNTESIKQIEILYGYKIAAYNNPDEDINLEYNIPSTVAFENLDLDININEIGNKNKKNDDIIQIEKLVIQFTNKINNEYYFSYDSINEFLVALNIEGINDLKMHFIHILLCTQKIYENYIKIIEDYKDSIIYKLSLDNSRIKDDVEKRCDKKYDGKIERRDEKNKKLKKEQLEKDDEITKLKEENLQKNDKITKLIKEKLQKDNEIKNLMEKLKKLENKNSELDSDLENQADESEIDF